MSTVARGTHDGYMAAPGSAACPKQSGLGPFSRLLYASVCLYLYSVGGQEKKNSAHNLGGTHMCVLRHFANQQRVQRVQRPRKFNLLTMAFFATSSRVGAFGWLWLERGRGPGLLVLCTL
jgi:hypothetical protein